jgi:tellurium resistance protein TerZ
MSFPQKGQKVTLNHTTKSRQRVLAGLSWDAREDKVGLMGKVLNTDSQHDLDISCYVYDRKGEFIDFVGAEAQDSLDQSGKIYHSGDDMSGAGEGDDESISAELAELPGNVHGIVYLVEIRSNHVFSEIASPYVRLADGMTDNNLLEINITDDDCTDKIAFVAFSIYRSIESPTGWMLYNVSEYPNIDQIEDWGAYLAQFVD